MIIAALSFALTLLALLVIVELVIMVGLLLYALSVGLVNGVLRLFEALHLRWRMR